MRSKCSIQVAKQLGRVFHDSPFRSFGCLQSSPAGGEKRVGIRAGCQIAWLALSGAAAAEETKRFELAIACRLFLEFLDSEPVFRRYGEQSPAEWDAARRALIDMTWRTYRHRWRNMYRGRLSVGEWVRAAFAMPFIPEYYASVLRTMMRRGASAARRTLGRLAPGSSR